MKKVFLLKFILIINLFNLCIAQSIEKLNVDFTTSLGSSVLVNRLSGTDQQASIFSQTNLFLNIPIKGSLFISTGFGYEFSRHIVDGQFTLASNQYNYEQVPGNFTQNEITLDYLNIPVLLKKNFGTPDKKFNLGFGPVFSNLLNASQKAKVNGSKVKVDAPVENKFRYGLNLDFDYKRRIGESKTAGIFGFGIYYQLSQNITDIKTFTPLTAYIRFGVGL